MRVVIAPSKTPRAVGERVKTDRRRSRSGVRRNAVPMPTMRACSAVDQQVGAWQRQRSVSGLFV